MRAIRLMLLWLLLPAVAFAGGPRFVTGPPFFTGPAGVPIGWKQAKLLYATDPGNLSASVNHAAADALVAAAASVWNVPVAGLTIAQGGELAEHVSGQNVYLDTAGLVFPNDVMSTNAAAVPIAVVYDSDGSVTDLLLGSGASDPSGCRQNAVTESVDSFDPAGYILHAIIVVNGRCTGSAAEMQTELQYQLMRVFGRVLGLAWSQTNDNVFTGTPTPTYAQALAWPIMHPLDIICGPYAYQCLPSPFVLRPDDIAAMVSVYPIASGASPASGKQVSLADAHAVMGHVYFPTGEGMAGVNVLLQREPYESGVLDPYYETSAVTGAMFQAAGSSPFVAAETTAQGSFGTLDQTQMGAYAMPYVPIYAGAQWQTISVSTEPVNALYSGSHSLGPFALGNVAPSGSTPVPQLLVQVPVGGDPEIDFGVADAAPVCGNGQDGTAAAPMQVPATGWWNGVLCGYGHASYVTVDVTPKRSFTLEVTALDADGLATDTKAMPVIGLFAPTDLPGSLPSLGAASTAFQSNMVGTTTITGQTGQLASFWFGIADERGAGRPDFTYQARLFYADSILPAEIGTSGGNATITGLGFRAGNAVTVNGVAAAVVSWSANSIVVTLPAMTAAGATAGSPVDVAVRDLSTGATSTLSAALTYTAAQKLPNLMRLLSAPSATAYVGDVAPVPFAVQLLAPDGATPVPGESVSFSATAGTVQFSACAAAVCTLKTDVNGIASASVTPETAGGITLQATDGSLSQTASFTALVQATAVVIWNYPTIKLPVGVSQQLQLVDLGPYNNGLPGRSVTLSALSGSATFDACGTAVCTLITDARGQIVASFTPSAVGPLTIQAADADAKGTQSFNVVSNTDTLTTLTAPAASTFLGIWSGDFMVSLMHADGVTPDALQTITYTASAGVTLEPCGTNVCSMTTNWSGVASVSILAQQTGNFSITAAFGALTQTVNFTVVPEGVEIRILSAPANNSPVGQVASAPFTIQLLYDGLYPLTGKEVALSGTDGEVSTAPCPVLPGCRMFSDSNGMASTFITPLVPGLITLSASYLSNIQSTSFTAVGPGESINILEQPASTGVWVGEPVNIEVQMMGADGVTPINSDQVNFAIVSGPFSFTDWYTNSVTRQADANGKVWESGVATSAGAVAVVVSDGKVSHTFNFTVSAHPDVMQLVSAPASGGYAGTMAPIPFAVRVFLPDGVTPAAGRSVTLAVTAGSANFSGCGGASCILQADSTGLVTVAVTPLAAGTIALLANEGGAQQVVSFTALAVPGADAVTLASAPGTSVYVGTTTAAPLAVLVTQADGTTPVAGIAVTFTASPQSAGSVQFSACAAAVCTVTTGANGIASTFVQGASAGAVALVATAALPTGAQSVGAPIQVVANILSVTAATPRTYVAAGATAGLPLTAVAVANGSPAAAQAIAWTGASGFLPVGTASVTDATGTTTVQSLLGPLAAGASASVSACGWPGICAVFNATGVAPGALQLSIIRGAGQSISGGAALSPLIALVTDSAGNPVVAASVNVYQTATAFSGACPAQGRCPASPVLAEQASVVVTGADGTLTIAPLTISGAATQTSIALSAGTQAFATATEINQP